MKWRNREKKPKLLYLFAFSVWLFLYSTSGFAEPVSIETAKQVAENWLSQKTGIDHQSLENILDSQIDFYTGGTPPAYHVVNMEQGGWVIVSGDDIAHPVIGYATDGLIDSVDPPPAFSEWMAQIKKEIESYVQGYDSNMADSAITAGIEQAWQNLQVKDYGFDAELADGAVSPLLTTTWSQGKYYNTQCPVDSQGPDGHALVGCVATAMAQVMKYHNWPAAGTGSHSYTHSTYGLLSANFGATNYNWSSIPASGRITSYNSAAATLLYHAGVSVEMDYGSSLSLAYTSQVATALKTYFKYKSTASFQYKSDYSVADWENKLRTELIAGRPMVYQGRLGDNGHAFVCDGYTGTNYFHFNWGWNGSYDGYFYLNDLTPGSFNFNSSQAAIIGIEPQGQTPPAATLISPVGSIGNNHTPDYRWNAVNDSTWYYLWVDGPGGNVIKDWKRASDVCSGSTCTFPSSFLNDGSYRWWIQTWNSSGYGPWSSGMDFTVGNIPPPAATLISPDGESEDNTPTYTWNAVSSSSSYYLWVNDTSGNKVKRWYTSAGACSGTTCSASPHTETNPFPALEPKTDHTWWVQTRNSQGTGPWSSAMQFRTPTPNLPPPPTLISPSGAISDSTPTYRWNVSRNATWYYLWVNDSSGNRIKEWYTSASICPGTTCEVTPTTQLNEGNGTWWVQPWSSAGYGLWSNRKDFVLSSPGGGFNSQFNGNASNWWWLTTSAPWTVNDSWFSTNGSENSWASTYYGSYLDSATMYGNFDYQVQLWRSVSSSSNGIMFRGSPNPAGDGQRWDHGYGFYYTRDGFYSIYKYSGGSYTSLVDWTASNAIKKDGAWNTLRVRANGSTVDFYINGTFVARMTNASYTTGKVGIAMYGADGTLWANYATLTNLATSSIADEVNTSGTDVTVIDEAVILAKGGASSNGDDIGFGQVLQFNDNGPLETVSESVPEIESE